MQIILVLMIGPGTINGVYRSVQFFYRLPWNNPNACCDELECSAVDGSETYETHAKLQNPFFPRKGASVHH
jgi:hypothetical protein